MSAQHEGKPASLLEVRGLTKIFGTLKACDNVDLTIGRGEIHALLGENGAGKSTLVKMLFGSLEPYSGEIRWNGEKVAISSPSVARKLGIGMVFQHFSLFEALSAAENIALSLDDDTAIGTVAAKARALLKGRPYVAIEDVKAVALPVLRHRVITNYAARADNITTDELIRKLLAEIPAREA